MPRNDVYNDYLNSNKIILALSGAEGFGLPEFQSVALGKHAVVLNATGYKQWANDSNSILVEPSSKIDVYDNRFFRSGDDFNQGQIFDWDEQSVLEAIHNCISRVKINPVNRNGLSLQDTFTWSKTVDGIIEKIKEIS